jgi:hypothetical protein
MPRARARCYKSQRWAGLASRIQHEQRCPTTCYQLTGRNNAGQPRLRARTHVAAHAVREYHPLLPDGVTSIVITSSPPSERTAFGSAVILKYGRPLGSARACNARTKNHAECSRTGRERSRTRARTHTQTHTHTRTQAGNPTHAQSHTGIYRRTSNPGNRSSASTAPTLGRIITRLPGVQLHGVACKQFV